MGTLRFLVSLCFCIQLGLLSLRCVCLAQTVIHLQSDQICNSSNFTHNDLECQSLDATLQNMQSNTTLRLSAGVYTVRTNYTILNKSDVSIIGLPDNPKDVIIECEDSYGLVFINVQRLYFNGLTVRHCGFKGTDRVDEVFQYLRQSIFLIFEPLSDFSTGIFIADCEGLAMENVLIKKNEGFGLVAINIIGDARFSYVHFINNHPSECILTLDEISRQGGSGGGMFLLYQDYVKESKVGARTSTLLIEHGRIENNYNCRLDLFQVQYDKLSRSLDTALIQDYSFIGAGGVTINLGQSDYTMNATIRDCLFTRNSGTYHTAGMEISTFEITTDSHVDVTDTIFHDNGGHILGKLNKTENVDTSLALDPGGALLTGFYLPLPSIYLNAKVLGLIINQHPSSVKLTNCTFLENTARSGSGVSILSFGPAAGNVRDRIIIQDCTFLHNRGDYGSAIFITEISYSAFEPGVEVVIDSIRAVGNQLLNLSAAASFQSDSTGVIDVNYVNISLTGRNIFDANQDTALSVYSGILTVSGFTNFSSNVGVYGGALNLDTESFLVLTETAEITFEHNRALIYGGGIYVNFDTVRTNKYDCFLFFDKVDIFCDILNRCNKPDNRFNISFIFNDAPFGKALFGSSFESCPWNRNGEGVLYLSINDTISANDSQIPLLFDPPKYVRGKTINTLADIIRTGNRTGFEDSPTLPMNNSIRVMPGQDFVAPLGAFDRLDQPVPLTIFSQLGDNSNTGARSIIGETDRFLLAGGRQRFSDVPIKVLGEQNVEYNMTITTDEALVDYTIQVYLTNCSEGFVFVGTRCVCEIDRLPEVMCNNNGTISYSEDNWIGRDEEGNYIQAPCILDFCKARVSMLNFSERDEVQCRNNRAGILCGQCGEGYSRMLGTTSCGVCDDNWYLLLILVFVVLGILLFVHLAIFNVTITDGYINGFIFYSNIVSLYTSNFLVTTAPESYPPQILISFLNLNFGIPSCFYYGVTELALAGWRFVFPLYLMLILLTVVLCGKYITHAKVSSFFRKINVTHVLATLIIYSYTSIIQTCFAVLNYTKIDGTPNRVRWRRDPNVYYEADLHIVLVVISVIFLVVLVPIPIVLLLPAVSLRIPYVKNLKPLIDAFIAPFAPGKTFWMSFRLLFRLVFIIISAIDLQTQTLVYLSVFIALLTVFQAYIKPFKSPSRNLIDTVLMVNLTLFSIEAIYLHPKTLNNEEQVTGILLTFTYLFLIMLLLLFVYYFLIRFRCTRVPYERAIEYITEKILQLKNKVTLPTSEKKLKRKKSHGMEPVTNPLTTHTSVSITSQGNHFEETGFIALREVLLEDPPTSNRSSNRSTAARLTGGSEPDY